MPNENTIPIWQVDAFADRAFSGNPAAVCMLDQFPDDSWMQNVAAEMNLSETAFLVQGESPNRFHLRWFTPAVEVELCGHATLASAHVLFEQDRTKPPARLRFQTKSGELTCERRRDRIEMDFPAKPTTQSVDMATSKELQDALGIEAEHLARSAYDILVVAGDASTVRNLSPNFDRLRKIETRGVIVTAKADESNVDFVSRFFAPRCDVDEDPVTGSAHCCLAPYWSRQLGRDKLIGYQASRRGGTVHCEVVGDRVVLSGNAITVMQANLLCSP